MDTKERFKDFVKKHPELLTYVKEKKKTWQEFYEIYDIYGEEENAWKEYFTVATTTVGTFDLMGFLKTIDLDSIKEGVNSVQRVIGLLQDITPSNTKTTQTRKPRPLYRHFDD